MLTSAEDFDVHIASGRLRARRHGAPGDPLLLCAHGLTANLNAFGHIAGRLAGPGRQVVAVDLRGRGRSDHGPRGSFGVDAHAEDLLAVATALGFEVFDFAGWSLGALAGIVIAGRAPGRLRSLSLIDHAGRMEPAAVAAVRGAMGRLDVVVDDPDDYVAAIRAAGTVAPWSEIWERHYRYELSRSGAGWRPATSREACEEDLEVLTTRSFRPLWPAITMPAVLVRCTVPLGGGLVVPQEERDAICDAVPHLRVVDIDRNHFGALTDDRTVAAIRSALDGVAA